LAIAPAPNSALFLDPFRAKAAMSEPASGQWAHPIGRGCFLHGGLAKGDTHAKALLNTWWPTLIWRDLRGLSRFGKRSKELALRSILHAILHPTAAHKTWPRCGPPSVGRRAHDVLLNQHEVVCFVGARQRSQGDLAWRGADLPPEIPRRASARLVSRNNRGRIRLAL
jgi:hypothetical protein